MLSIPIQSLKYLLSIFLGLSSFFSSTFFLLASETPVLPWITLSTVPTDTPAFRAMSFMRILSDLFSLIFTPYYICCGMDYNGNKKKSIQNYNFFWYYENMLYLCVRTRIDFLININRMWCKCLLV